MPTTHLRPRLSQLRIAVSLAVCGVSGLSGCAMAPSSHYATRVDEQTKAIEALIAPPASKVNEGAAPLDITPLAPVEQTAIERAWLRQKKVDFIPNKKNPAPIPASEILKMFRENGINITTALPIDSYTYSGNGVKGVDGETALQMILGQMGLDYDTDEKGRFITVVPMKSLSWTINLGNRTSHSENSSFDSLCRLSSSSSTNTSSNSSATGTTSTSTSTATQGVTQATTNNAGSTGSTGASSVQTQENFWAMLTAELNERMTVLIPIAGNSGAGLASAAPAVPAIARPGGVPLAMPQAIAPMGGSALYTKQTIGTYAINPVTGHVTIQAPGWLLRQLRTYMNETIMPMYNTSMTFEGTVVNVRSSRDVLEGIDLSALATYASKYGVALNNNILGGISLGSNGISYTYSNASTLPGSGSAFGVVSDSLQIFNAYLSTLGGTEILNRPVVTVTSGVPVEFGRLTPIYTNEQTQSLSSGSATSNALVTIQNNIIEHQYGSLLRIMPHFDPNTRRVRAQVSLLQRPLVGYQNLTLSLMTATGSIENQVIRKPQIECSVTSTEAILDDGELIIIGGQVESNADTSHSGVTGLMDMPGIQALTSQQRKTGAKTTMYFALRVRLNTKPNPQPTR